MWAEEVRKGTCECKRDSKRVWEGGRDRNGGGVRLREVVGVGKAYHKVIGEV